MSAAAPRRCGCRSRATLASRSPSGALDGESTPATPPGGRREDPRHPGRATGELDAGPAQRRVARLSEADVRAHFTPEFLAAVMPASQVMASLAQTAAERGPFTITGFATPPAATKAIALIETGSGSRGSVRI